MDIHPPDEPIHSWRDVALHLGIVTVGILIALGLESLVEWRHHGALANEARQNIVSELRDNRAEVSWFLKEVPGSRKQIQNALGFTQDLAAHRKLHGTLNLVVNRSDVSDTSWTTAQAIGALTYMRYGEVKKYGAVYELQNELAREQTKSFTDLSSALASLDETMDAATPNDADLRLQRDRLNSLSSELLIEEQVAVALLKRYDGVLSAK
ncbi:MAG: hypothetical protein M3Y57_21370 [Acidobacteriota bacterium]|nr:hypothetical protein [Acidobacteriota bacterium]